MKGTPLANAAHRTERRLGELARISEERGRLTRTFLSPAMRRANRRVGSWMRGAGLEVREDFAGNLIGRLRCGKRGARTLLIGSHLDTVRGAGRFDGALGVLLGIAAVEQIRRGGIRLPFDVEVLGFSDEEGVRFSGGYLGSKAFAGGLSARDLRLTDASGLALRRALEARLGRRIGRLKPAHSPGELVGYFEAHIEQGPRLEAEKLAVGAVSAIAGQTRGLVTFRGRAGHAGTTPMAHRRDALAGAAELVLFMENLARRRAPLVATAGSLVAKPGLGNVIAGEAAMTLDVRHPRDGARKAALGRILARARAIARRRRLGVAWSPTLDEGAIACSPALNRLLGRSVRAVQGRSVALVSGAGHDAVALSALAPVAMLFVRCCGGVSHHRDEFASVADIEAALRVAVDFVGRLARREHRLTQGRSGTIIGR